ncbi:glycerophosphodiester phosphodiesterase family protein [Luteipulveratus sp. YIM 133132]|uniref:glycerophosphodiester phosphodiesterase family protein n=1 Tax=Luteipulveratus flavus TaxID=3031728 RepID=UPI0023AEBA7B|nr:glycerophosphodiester phosphodiesterase family protein [Luteipulveratus sp. YIM 133132]MDE9364891.1 glycerophosphodiester phosphodiesterase family protein [Luteipulveratus sp. YIM 133132]
MFATEPSAPAGPVVVAHRGGAGLAAENTLAAFAASWALGVRVLETDARVTADGVVLAFHDATLDRTTSRTGPVRAEPWHRLRAEPGVLRLEDLLESFPDAELLVDVKDEAAVEPLAATLRRTGSGARVCVAGAWDSWLQAVVDRSPGTRSALGWKSLSGLMWGARLGTRPLRPLRAGAVAAHVPWRLGGMPWLADGRVASRLVALAHDHGLLVRAWTINDPDHQRRLARDGVDAIITDRPDLAQATLAGPTLVQGPTSTTALRDPYHRTAAEDVNESSELSGAV